MEAVNPNVRSFEPKYEDDLKCVRALAAPLPKEDVKFAPFKTGDDWAIVGPYADVRAVRRRLNKVVGMDSWRVGLDAVNDGYVCELTLELPSGRTIQGQDAASNTDIEAHKGGASSAIRRAASAVAGIGEYFYKVGREVDPYFCDYDSKEGIDRGDAFKKMPSWALLIGPEQRDKLVAYASDRGIDKDKLEELIWASDLPFNAFDEVPQSAAADLRDLIIANGTTNE